MLSLAVYSGIDTIRVSRIDALYKRRGPDFLSRIYTSDEMRHCQSKAKGMMESLAARFAAKEAVSKALGTGIWQKGVRFTDIEIVMEQDGRPSVSLSSGAYKVFKEIGGQSISVSMTHDGDLAMAVCVIEYIAINKGGELL